MILKEFCHFANFFLVMHMNSILCLLKLELLSPLSIFLKLNFQGIAGMCGDKICLWLSEEENLL